MKTKEGILSILKKEMPYLKEEFPVRAIGLFGSYSREQQREGSDIDLLAEFGSTIDFVTLFRLEDYLSERLGSMVEIRYSGRIERTDQTLYNEGHRLCVKGTRSFFWRT